MLLKSIRLRGFRGFAAGIGVDEVFVDLSGLPDGLIAICGPNGSGKTTLLDSLHPYRIQPYKIRKAKDWSPGAFSFYDQCSGSDACKELIFEMGGVTYRSLILIDADKRKQEAYLYHQVGAVGGNPWVPLNDGKVKTYDEAVEKVCGSASLFFTSVFRCQGAKNLSDYTRSDIMQIISELLNIDHIKAQGDKCREVVSGLNASLALTRDRISGLSAGTIQEAALLRDIENQDSYILGTRSSLTSCNADLETVRADITATREKQAAQASETARLNLLRTQEYEERKRLSDGVAAHKKVVDDFDKRIADVATTRDRAVASIQSRIAATNATGAEVSTSLRERIARADKIASGADVIRKAVADEVEMSVTLSGNRLRLAESQSVRDAAFKHVSEYQSKLSQAKNRMDSCRKDADKLDGLDCRNDESGWLNPSCRFISDAVAGREALPELEAEYGSLFEDCSAAQALAEADETIKNYRTAIQLAEASLAEYQKFTRLLPELEQAETNVTIWEVELEGLDAKTTATVAEFDADIVALQLKAGNDAKLLEADKWLAVSEWEIFQDAMNARIAALYNEVLSFPVGDDLSAILPGLVSRESELLAAIDAFGKSIRAAELEIASLNTKLEVIRLNSVEATLLSGKEGRLVAEIAKFSQLMKACSNDGIIALELDDAAPSIAAIVNDLLRACYGARFTVRLDTQGLKVNGDTKETFDIVVFDSESGDEKSITEMSGGQITVVEDAITRGICLYNIHRSDRVYETLYSDEKDGALDEARKLEFMRVKREALRVGTHRNEFFITQTQDLVDLADARIVLSPGGVTIQ